MKRFSLSFLLSILSISLAQADPDYREFLNLQPLTPSSLLASFSFWANDSLRSYEQQHFKFIPRSLGQILQRTKTQELHLRFTTGRWNDESWGQRPRQGYKEGGTGVELWAWVEADSDEASFDRWTTLNHALSGLFCASLNFIDSTRTARPRMTFEQTGDCAKLSSNNVYLLHGSLPREVVCTENLTPFLKLLPCKGKAGIASLLDGHKLFDASWQSMSIDVRSVCPDERSACSIEMEQTVDMVLDTDRSKRPRDNPIPRPMHLDALFCDETKNNDRSLACYPSDATYGQSWTLAEIFGRPIQGSCLAEDVHGNTRDSVCINVPEERVIDAFGANMTEHEAGKGRCFKLTPDGAFEMVLSHTGPQTLNSYSSPALYASRSFTGHGQERGGVQTLLTNPSTSAAVEFVYYETLPWFMKPYLHTLRTRLSTSPSADLTIIQETIYRPALDRRRGTQIELLMSVPPASTVILTYDYEKAILRYTEYPPDANRGFDVAPAVVKILPSVRNTSVKAGGPTPEYLRTTSLLLPLPTPDFSMPYNVIILTSTVMALAFGMIFNLLVRRFVATDEVERWDARDLKAKIRGAVVFLQSLMGMKAGSKWIHQKSEKKDQ